MSRWLVAAALVVTMNACSVFLVTGAPDPPAAVECTDHYASPVVDTVLGAGGLGAGITFALLGGCPADARPNECDGNIVYVMGSAATLIPGVIYALSAVIGYAKVSECRRAKAGNEAPGTGRGDVRRDTRR